MSETESSRRKIDWNSILGAAIFLTIIAWRVLGRWLPANVLPYLIGGIVLLAIIVPAANILVKRTRRNEQRLPTTLSQHPTFSNQAMPPFGGPDISPTTPPAPRAFSLPRRTTPELPPPLRFEPVFNPKIILAGIVGVVVLGAAALVFYVVNTP